MQKIKNILYPKNKTLLRVLLAAWLGGLVHMLTRKPGALSKAKLLSKPIPILFGKEYQIDELSTYLGRKKLVPIVIGMDYLCFKKRY